MPARGLTKVATRHAQFFEIVSFGFALICLLNVFVEMFFLYIKDNWYMGQFRNYHFIVMQFFAVSFFISLFASVWFSVIRKAQRDGNLNQ